ncbi:Ubiquitin carboxyl-terminal hydrolase 36 [Orbilia ellipsospora]|uniref:ubiquitinyl hydrolase 1 n=1 Tax=Orbilia ellipsospora TaxID=2528407 RepID=A0AAV9WWD4_9PEZI
MSLCALLAQPIPFVRESSSSNLTSEPIPDKYKLYPTSTTPGALQESNSTITSSSSPNILANASPRERYDHSQLQVNKRKRTVAEAESSKLNFPLLKKTKLEGNHIFQASPNTIQQIQEAPNPLETCLSVSYSEKAHDKASSLVRGRGYLNRSGTHCYRNASLQALGSVLEFRALVLNHNCGNPKQCACCYLRIVFREHYQIHGTRLSPHEPVQLRFIAHFIGGPFARTKFPRQEDAHEYIALLLDRISAQRNRATPANGKNHIGRMFTSSKITRIICANPTCKSVLNVRSMDDTLIMLNMPKFTRKRQELSLEDCLQHYTKSEYVADYRCEECGRLGIEKKLIFETPPQVALIALSRFKFGWSEGRAKDRRSVTYPESLAWSSYTQNHSGKSRLMAIICHESSNLDSGHYYAIVRCGLNIWLKYDDEQVVRVKNPLKTLEQKWYMLLYERQVD